MFKYVVDNFEQWRDIARNLITHDIKPDDVIWSSKANSQASLFDDANIYEIPIIKQKKCAVPKGFLQLAKLISYHRDIKKWHLLYEMLWRIQHEERQLLKISSDPLVCALLQMAKAIKRDAHKMKAFVRFCQYSENDHIYYLAWYKPDHLVVQLVAPFFQRRFAVMHWSIITPDETVAWDGKELQFSEGKIMYENPQDDMEYLWQTYYKAIFNPARVKIAAMKREMPVRFWHNLPETKMIPSLLNNAAERAETMISSVEGIKSSAAEYFPKSTTSIQELRKHATGCQGCPLYKTATQTVFGVGNSNAPIMLVGEQPGDVEDIQGLPFVGPAGKLLQQSLVNASVDKTNFYFTNAVKHFKYTLINSQRVHRSPSIREVNACKPWLTAEIEAIKPKIILCLGLTAAKALINPGFKIKEQRGVFIKRNDYIIGATYHPAAILRAIDREKKQEMLVRFEEDINQAYQYINY